MRDRSTSSETGTNRQPVCDFLLVINSNRDPVFYRLPDTAMKNSKIAGFTPPRPSVTLKGLAWTDLLRPALSNSVTKN